MTNPYNMQMGYSNNQMQYPYQTNPQGVSYSQTQKGGVSTFGMMTLGALGGGTFGYLKSRHPIDKKGKASDSFVKQAFENHVNKNYSSDEKKLYKQSKEIVAKLDKIKDVEGMKKFLTKNKEAINEICKGMKCSFDDLIMTLSADNLKVTKKSLKESFNMANNMKYQQFKNFTEKCWDKEAKKFTIPEGFSKEIYDVITNTKSSRQWKKALKYGGVAAGVLGALTIGYKMAVSNN